MLIQLTPAQLTSLERLYKQPLGTEISKLLDAEIAALVDRMVDNSDIAVLHECRGRIKALREFQSSMRDAEKTLGKMGRTSSL